MMDETTQLHYLSQLGITAWQSRLTVDNPVTPALQPPTVAPDETWQQLQHAVSACTQCELHCSRTQTVFGCGDINANLLIVGEAPGFHEDQQGEPFVGRAGQLLNNMLLSIGLNRQQVFIANVLKCRPPNNRDPKSEEVALCTPFLIRQINLLKPKAILAVGRIAAHFLLKTNTPLSKMRGRQFEYENIPLLITYHPAYLLRSPRDKTKAWQDLCQVKQLMGL